MSIWRTMIKLLAFDWVSKLLAHPVNSVKGELGSFGHQFLWRYKLSRAQAATSSSQFLLNQHHTLSPFKASMIGFFIKSDQGFSSSSSSIPGSLSLSLFSDVLLPMVSLPLSSYIGQNYSWKRVYKPAWCRLNRGQSQKAFLQEKSGSGEIKQKK